MLNTNKIKGRMRELGIVQKDVAEALNIRPPTASQKINGIRPMSLDEAKELADLLRIDPADFGTYFFAS